MHEFLISLEQLSFSTWVREGGSIWGFATILFLHAVGLGMVAGIGTVIDLRLLGVAPSIPIKPMERLFPFIWAGFFICLVSGLALGMADATVKLTNPVFWVKMGLVAVGVVATLRMRSKVFGKDGSLSSAQGMAWISLICWIGAIVAGRLLGYTGEVAGLASL